MSKKSTAAQAFAAVSDDDMRAIAPLLTVGEVAGLLRCSVSSLNKWRISGRGPRFIRVGSRVRYREGDIAAFVEAQTVTGISN